MGSSQGEKPVTQQVRGESHSGQPHCGPRVGRVVGACRAPSHLVSWEHEPACQHSGSDREVSTRGQPLQGAWLYGPGVHLAEPRPKGRSSQSYSVEGDTSLLMAPASCACTALRADTSCSGPGTRLWLLPVCLAPACRAG